MLSEDWNMAQPYYAVSKLTANAHSCSSSFWGSW